MKKSLPRLLFVAAAFILLLLGLFFFPEPEKKETAAEIPRDAISARPVGSNVSSPPIAASPLPAPEDSTDFAKFLAAAQSGTPVAIGWGKEEFARLLLRPMTVTAENFRVSTGTTSSSVPSGQVFEGLVIHPGHMGVKRAFVAAVDGAISAMLFTEDAVLHFRAKSDGGWVVLEESMPLEQKAGDPHACHAGCVHEEGGHIATSWSAVPVLVEDAEAPHIGLDPEWLASNGEDPFTGEATFDLTPVPWGPLYDASLKTILALMVDENGGANTAANIAAKTSNFLALTAALHSLYENQLGMKFLLQELIVITEGSDLATPALNVNSDGPDLVAFHTWINTHRRQYNYGWTIAAKVGTVANANGRAYIRTAGGYYGVGINNALGYMLVGHEIGHNLGAMHTNGGVMNASVGSLERDFFRTVTDSNPALTAAQEIYNYMSVGTRAYGAAPLRHPAQMPFANDDFAVTKTGQPVSIPALANDAVATPLGTVNTLSIVEVGSVFPAHAGTVSFTPTAVSFSPAPGFHGQAYFSYTLRGNVGNGGAGWLHKADVGVHVQELFAGAPTVQVTRGETEGAFNNERTLLSWTRAGAVPFQWEIQRSTGGSAFETVATVPGTMDRWIDRSVSLASNVQYRIRARDQAAEAGSWGLSPLLEAAGATQFWEDFSAGNLQRWTLWNNAPTSTSGNDATAPLFLASVQQGRASLQTGGAAPRLGLLVSNQTYNITQTGALSLSADMVIDAVPNWRRVVAWIDNGGAVVWIGLERNLDNNNQRKVRLYAVNTLTEFFAQVANYNSAAMLHENPTAGMTGFVSQHRTTLTVAPSGVAMAVFPASVGNPSRPSGPASTLGLKNHGLTNFTGVGRFAVGGYASPTGSTTVQFQIDNVAISSAPVPQRYLPAMQDDQITVPRGSAVALRPLTNDLGSMTSLSVHSAVPTGLRAAFNPAGSDSSVLMVEAYQDTPPGLYSFQLRPQTSGYQNATDGLIGYSTVTVEVVDAPTLVARNDHYTLRTDETTVLRFNPLLNDTASGLSGLTYTQPRVSSTTSGTVENRTYRLVSATLSNPSMGSIALQQINAMEGGVIVSRPTGEITFTLAGGNQLGLATVQYTIADARGNTQTATATIQVVGAGFPRITAHPLGVAVLEGEPFSLSVTASGTGPLSYQWKKDGLSVSGATGASYNIPTAAVSQGGSYTVDVTNAAGTITSLPASVHVTSVAPEAPVILTQPQPVAAQLGSTRQFSVAASGRPTPTYQWRKNGTPLADGGRISGVQTPTLTLAQIEAQDVGNYDVVVSNAVDTVTSNSATLGIAPSVTISSPNNGVSVVAGTSISFTGSVTDAVDGNLTASGQWSSSLDGSLGTGGSLSRSNLSVGTHVVSFSATNSGGLVGSSMISLTITAPPPPPGSVTYHANTSVYDAANWRLLNSNQLTTQASMNTGNNPSGVLQTFRPPATVQVAAFVLVVNNVNDGQSYTLRLHDLGTSTPTNNITVTEFNNSVVVSSGSVTVPVGTKAITNPGGAGLPSSVRWNLATPVTLQSGRYYALSLGNPSSSTTPIVWRYHGASGAPNLYADGAAYGFTGGSSWGINTVFNSSWNNDMSLGLVYPSGFQINTPPTVQIVAPTTGSNFTEGTAIGFTATASDSEDGNIAATGVWTSNVDGVLGSGASLSVSSLALGPHTITYQVEDAGGLSTQATVQLTIVPPPVTYAVEFLAGAGGSLEGQTTQTIEQGNASVAVTAVPQSGFIFVNWTWTGGNSSTANPLTISNITQNLTVTANFAAAPPPASAIFDQNFNSSSVVANHSGTAANLFDFLGTDGNATNNRATLSITNGRLRNTVAYTDDGNTVQLSASRTTRVTNLPVESNFAVVSASARLAPQAWPAADTNYLSFTIGQNFRTGIFTPSTGTGNGPAFATLTFQARSTANTFRTTGAGGNGANFTVAPSGGVYQLSLVIAANAGATAQTFSSPSGNHTVQAGRLSVWIKGTLRIDNTATGITAANLEDFSFSTGSGTGSTFAAGSVFNGYYELDDVKVQTVSNLAAPANTAPIVAITAPTNNPTVTQGANVTFTSTATDAEDGNLAVSATWTSSLDGALGTGSSLSTSALSVGTHTITCAVTDSGGLSGSDQITLNVITPYSAWTTAAGLSGADVLPDTDLQGDGMPNLLKYALGGTPTTPARDLTPVLTPATHLEFTFNRIADPTLTYEVWASSNLTDWGQTPIWTSTGGQNLAGSVTVTDTVDISTTNPPRRFLRLRVRIE